MKNPLPLLTAAAFLLPLPVFAQPAPPPPPPGETVLNLSATEHGSVPQDLLTASLSIQVDNADPRAVQDKINSTIAAALAKAKPIASVETSTDSYYVSLIEPFWNGKGQKPAKFWRGMQSLQLKGRNAADLIALSGALQNLGLTMQGLNYSVSPDKFDTARDALMDAAIQKLKAKAERAAKALGKTKVDVVELNVDGNNAPPIVRPMMMAKMAMADAAAPIAAPNAASGSTDIDLTVNAKVILRP